MNQNLIFNPPPGWPQPPAGWTPPKGWTPDPKWPQPPPGWELWLPTTHSFEQSVFLPEKEPTSINDSKTVQESLSDAEKLRILKQENDALRRQLESLRQSGDSGNIVLNDDHILQEIGIYRYHHPLENASCYQTRLLELDVEITQLVKSGRAIEKSNLFTYDNSLEKGRRMADDLAKLMLRAYNAEAESSVRSLRAGNAVTARLRLERSREAIARLGRMMEMRISDEFHQLRIREIELTSDFLMKKQEEKEEAREERARLREERKVAAELAAERERLDKERNHLLNAIEALRRKGASDSRLEEKLSELDVAIVQNDYRSANIRAGYVYVISNRGAFGPNVVKIGLTRRLEPLERVDELGDASVPFRFDVHGLFFSEDAVTLEMELHSHFADRRLNHANTRKEFFFASPVEIRELLKSKMGNMLEFNDHADATDFHQSVGSWPDAYRERFGI